MRYNCTWHIVLGYSSRKYRGLQLKYLEDDALIEKLKY